MTAFEPPSLLREYFLSVLAPLLAIGALAEPGLARRAAEEALVALAGARAGGADAGRADHRAGGGGAG